MNKKELKKLKEETDEKFADRVDKMIYGICGCEPKRAKTVLQKCLKRADDKIRKRKNEKNINY